MPFIILNNSNYANDYTITITYRENLNSSFNDIEIINTVYHIKEDFKDIKSYIKKNYPDHTYNVNRGFIPRVLNILSYVLEQNNKTIINVYTNQQFKLLLEQQNSLVKRKRNIENVKCNKANNPIKIQANTYVTMLATEDTIINCSSDAHYLLNR